jgi:hypothetical protein
MKLQIAFLHPAAAKFGFRQQSYRDRALFSAVSTLIFSYLYHESVDFRTSEPELDHVEGPLTSANIALPWLIFFRRREWLQRLNDHFDVATFSTRPLSALSYMVTGGISRRLPVPCSLYRAFFSVDLTLNRCFPRLCAAFFTIVLPRR